MFDQQNGIYPGSNGQPTGLLLASVTVVDPRTGTLLPNTDVRIQDGKVSSLSPSGAVPPQPNDQVVDAHGKFLVPGFLDMHMHCLQDPSPADSFALMLSYGITGVRQMAGSSAMLKQRREGAFLFGPQAPELLAMPGDILTSANAATPEASVLEVQKQKAEGADFIKTIFVTPKVFAASLAESKRQGLAYGGHVSPGVDMVQASNAGLNFVEHLGPVEVLLINSSKLKFLLMLLLKLRPPAAMKLSIADGADAIKMIIVNPILFRLKLDPASLGKTQRLIDTFDEAKNRELAKTFARNGTWQCPTLIRNTAMQFGDDPEFTQSPYLRYVPREYRELWADAARQYGEKLTKGSRATLRQLKELSFRLTKIQDDAGVKMMAGSDCGGGGGWVIPGISLHQEFDFLERAGLSPLKVLQMTTSNAAEFLNRQDTLGCIRAGRQADMVLLEGNPLDSVQNLHGIAGVVRAGTFYSADTLGGIRETIAAKTTVG